MGTSLPASRWVRLAARASFLAACALVWAATGALAQSGIRVSEVFFACASGDTTVQYVELENTGPDTVFTGNLRLGYLRDPDTGQFNIAVGSSVAGLPWAHGGHYLVGSSAVGSKLLLAPDFSNSQIKLARSGGILTLYNLDETGAHVVRDEIRYGAFGTISAPPDGFSLGNILGAQQAIQPTPQRRDGETAGATSCFGAILPGDFALTELMFRCPSGLVSGQFMEIASLQWTREMTSDLGLRYFDHRGQLLADLPGVFASGIGRALGIGRAWLLAPQGSTILGVADGTFAVPMDTTAGRLVLYRARAEGDSILTDLRYGTSGDLPLPPPGSSLAWNPLSGTYAIYPQPTPMDYSGVVHAIALDCMGPAVSSARIHELQVRCTDGNPGGRFLEIQPTSSPDQFDPSLNVAVYDHNGALVGEETGLFGARAGSPWPIASRWLLATDLFTDDAGRLADGPLSLPLDPLGGRVELRARRHDDGVVVVVDAVTYGTPETPAPPPGQGLIRSAGGAFVVSPTMQPQGFSGASYHTPETCHRPEYSSARISELQLRCTDGGLAGRFVELEPAKTPDTLDSTLAIVVYDHAGALIGEHADLFGSRTGGLWPAGSHWLVATEAYSSASGLPADSPFPIHPDTLGGRIELRARSRIDGSVAIVDALSYGLGVAPVPPPGQSLLRSISGGFVVAPRPAPQGFAAQDYKATLDCRRPRVSSIRIAELGLRCQGGSIAYQFIELAPQVLDDILEAGLTLRAFDARHVLIGEIADVFGPRAGGEFPTTGPWFIGSPPWRNGLGAGPETTLPFTLDRLGGSIELSGHDRVTGEPVVLQVLEYGTPEVSAPAPGQSLIRNPDGSYALGTATPQGSNGDAFLAAPECSQPGVASAFVRQFSLACTSGSVAGQFVDIDLSAADDFIDSSLAVQAYDHAGRLLGTIHVLADSRRPGSTFKRRSIATRFWKFDYSYDYYRQAWDYQYDTILPFVLDRTAGRILLTARDRAFGDSVVVQDLRYGSGGVPAPAPGTGLARTEQGGYAAISDPAPRPDWYGGAGAHNTGCESAHLDEVFTACREGTADVSYVRLAARTNYPYYLGSAPLDGVELRAWGADGALRLADTVLVGGSSSVPLGDHLYLATSPGFASELGAAGDRALHGALDSNGGRVALGWTTPAGSFEAFDELIYGPAGVPAPAPGRSLARDVSRTWKESAPFPVTFDGRTFRSPTCFDSVGWAVALQEIFPSCRCDDAASFIELAAIPFTVFERGLTLVAFDRLGAERWRLSDLFSSRAGLSWPAGQTFLAATPAAKGDLFGGNAPDAVLPGSLDAEGGRVLVLRGATAAHPETLASFAYGPGTPNQKSLRGWSYQLQPDGSYAQGYPSPTAFGSATPWIDAARAPACLGTGGRASIDQALWSCKDGSTGVSYIALTSSLGNFPDDMGVRAFGRDGGQLFRLEHPFAFDACGPIADGVSRWLLATAGMEQICGSSADGRMPVPLDPVAGIIETFRMTPAGDVTVQNFHYGGPLSLVVPPGSAGQPGSPGKVVDPHPVRSDGRALRAPSCLAEGPAVVTIGEVLLRCGDGGVDAQYVRLVGGNDPDFHDSRLRLLVRDHSGAELFRLDPLAPELEGRPVPAHGGLLLAGPSLASRTGLAPDVVLPQALDAEGGTLRLEWVRAAGSTPMLLDEVMYGPGTPLQIQPAGMAIRPHDESRLALHYPALPMNLAGERPTSRACYTDSCSAFSLNGHFAYPDSIRGKNYDCGRYSTCSITSYDWTELSVSAYVGVVYYGGSAVAAYDDFVAEGLPDGTPVSFSVRFEADLYGSDYSCPYPFCHDSYVSHASAGFSLAGVHEQLPTVKWTLDTTITRSVTVRAGEPFRLTLHAEASAETEDGGSASGEAVAKLVPADLPPGVTLRSCWGFVTSGVVAVDVSLATASATRDGVRLEWRTALGSSFSAVLERRSEDSPWFPLATLLADGLGALKYEDHDVRAGQTYDYRLRWSDGKGAEHTSGVVTLQVPQAPRFAFGGAWPNPARGALSLHLVLDDSGPARLDFFDVSGRRVASQSLALDPGEHVVPIPFERRLPPGIYAVRLRQGAHAATRRLIVIP